MKRMALGGIVCMVAGTAHAQSSVTLYGVADSAVRYTNNAGGGRLLQETSGTPNIWGLTGTEDLGGGLAAIFKLTNGYIMANGKFANGGLLFGQQSYVGIKSSTFGTTTFGRQYDLVDDYLQPLSWLGQHWGGDIGAHFGDVDNLGDTFWINNSVKYTSPLWRGVSFGALYSFGGIAGHAGQNNAYSLGGSYTAGPVVLAVAYESIDNPIVSVYGGSATNVNGTFPGGPYVGLQFASKLKIFGAGGSYQFSKLKVSFLYTDSKLPDSALAKGDAEYQVFELNSTYSIAPDLLVSAAYAYTLGKWSATDKRPKFHQVSLGTLYGLSKRTWLYVKGAYERAAGDAQFAEIGGGAIPASNSKSQLAVECGIRHYF
jgi:general bacterial porin, GBP family